MRWMDWVHSCPGFLDPDSDHFEIAALGGASWVGEIDKARRARLGNVVAANVSKPAINQWLKRQAPPVWTSFERLRLNSCLVLCYPPGVSTVSPVHKSETPRHTAIVRVTHWITVVSFLALLISGTEIVVSHPRFYWGEVGNALTPPMFTIPIPASRATVPTGYGFVMPDQNGWSRYLHFEAAWVVLLTGLVYAISGLFAGHFRNNLFPVRADRNWGRSGKCSQSVFAARRRMNWKVTRTT